MMRLLSVILILINFHVKAAGQDSTIYYNLPDSIKAVSFIADVNIASHGKKEVYAGLGAKQVKLLLQKEKNKGEVSFEFLSSAEVIAKGFDVDVEEDEIEWKFNWKNNTTYTLMIASAADSAENFTIYSGYIYLPDQQKWKLIGSSKIKGEREAIINPVAIQSRGRKKNIDVGFSNVMVQRAAGSWKRIDNSTQSLTSPPCSTSCKYR